MQTFTGLDYLKIDIANSYGFDKLDWDARISWFDSNEQKLFQLLPEAAEPALYYAGLQAWRQVGRGEPIGYPISLDATASGLQLLACLTGDRRAAEICNVVDTGHRQDAYTAVWQAMMQRVENPGLVTREMAKDAVMTSLYGSTAVPKRVFGEGEQLSAFYATMEEETPAAWELNRAFLAMWNSSALEHCWVLPDNFHVRTKVMRPVTDVIHVLNTPHEVTYQINAPEKEGRSLGANCIHSLDGLIVREMTRRCDHDPQAVARVRTAVDRLEEPQFDQFVHQRLANQSDQMVCILWDHYLASGYLSARILDHLEEANVGWVTAGPVRELLDSLPEKPFQLLSVHDCFRCLPHYGDDLRRQYNLQLMLIARSDLLSFLTSQLMGRKTEVTKHDPDLWKDILASDYALS